MARKGQPKVKETREQRRARQEATTEAQKQCMKFLPYVIGGITVLLFVFGMVVNRMEPASPEVVNPPGAASNTPEKASTSTETPTKRKPGRIDMASISTQSELDDYCYHIKKGTCALILHRAEEAVPEEAPPLAIKYARSPINFYTVAVGDNAYADLDFAASFTVEFALPSIVVVKNGKRPRYATAPVGEFGNLVTELLEVGGVQFTGIDVMPKLQSGRKREEEEAEEREMEAEFNRDGMAEPDTETPEEEEDEEVEVQEL